MFCLCRSLHSSWLITAIVDMGLEIGKQGWALSSVFFFFNSQITGYLDITWCSKLSRDLSFGHSLSVPCPACASLAHTGPCCNIPRGAGGPAQLSRQCTPLPAAGRPPLPGTPSRGPLTSTQVEGDATFWPPETLSDNSSVQFERLHREVADF